MFSSILRQQERHKHVRARLHVPIDRTAGIHILIRAVRRWMLGRGLLFVDAVQLCSDQLRGNEQCRIGARIFPTSSERDRCALSQIDGYGEDEDGCADITAACWMLAMLEAV
eukprot:2622643-Pleurochrysis_carterae.AAC.2